MRKTIKKILAIGCCVALFGATLTGCVPRITEEQLEEAKQTAYEEGQASIDINQIRIDAINSVDISRDNEAAIQAAMQTANITREECIIEEAKKVAAEIEKETETKGYDIDELEIGAEFSETLSDRELEVLFDGEVKFDDDDYDAEEVVYLTNLKIANNIEDVGTDTYLIIPEGGIKYCMTFETKLDTSEIDEDETLIFNLLGEEVEISKWNSDKVTLIRGVSDTMEEGEEKTITVDGKAYNVKVITITDSTPYQVKFSINGELTKALREGTLYDVDENIQIVPTEILPNEAGDVTNDVVTFRIGEKVKETIEDGDEYEKDSIWEYKIATNSICLTLIEEFSEIDEDEEYKALGVGDKLSLPNDYVCIEYKGLTEEDIEKYTFDLDTKQGNEYVRVKGEFLSGINDYEKVYINASGIYDEDLDLIDVTTIDLGDTKLTLNLIGSNITIDDVKTNLDLSILEVGGISISSEEEDYLTTYGIVIKSPEDNLDDKELEIIVPEEKLTAEVTVFSK